MSINEKIDLLIRFVTAENPEEQGSARNELRAQGVITSETRQEIDARTAAEDFLTQIGMPSRLAGYRYLTTAITELIQNPELARSLVKGLYSHVAEIHNSTSSKVERTCRHAIELAFERCDYKLIEELLGYSIDPDKGCPTVGEFITRAAVIVKRRLKAV